MSEKPKPMVQLEEKDATRFINWTIRHKRSESGIAPPQHIIDIARKYNWFYSGYAYRGLQTYSWDDRYKRVMKKKKGDKMIYKSRKYQSWTKSKHIAVCFTVGNHPLSLSRSVIVKNAKRYRSRGIVIKGRIENGLDVNKALSDLEKMAETNQIVSRDLSNMPGFGSEKEILGQSVDLVEIVDKINY